MRQFVKIFGTHKDGLIMMVLLCTMNVLMAQRDFASNPAYGRDSTTRITCASNLSTMSEFYRINMFDYAYDAWRSCFVNCPKASKNIYVMGARILKHKIENASDNAIKQQFVDTLLMLYDKRIEHFGQEGYVCGRKGIDILRYRPEEIEKAHQCLSKSAELEKENSEEAVLVTFLQSTNVMYKNNQRSAEDLVSIYLQVTDYLAQSKSKDTATLKAASESVEKIFSESGAASCSMLDEIFTSRYEKNPTDVEMLKRITRVFDRENCTASALFAKSSESLYKIEPSANAAYNIARIFETQNNLEKASYYYSQATELETDNKIKATYFYKLSLIAEQQGEHTICRTNALKAAELNPAFGDPYMVIGMAYAMSSSACGSNAFERGSVFWAAVDMFIKAKNTDPALTEKANEYIAKYSAYFPTKEEAFFNSYSNGMSYTVGCWIGEKTVVRTR